MAQPPELKVWLDDRHVADLQRRPDGSLRSRYTEQALDGRWQRNSPILSCSLPLGARPQPADAFFRGLLPEGRALQALAALADVAASDAFGLLTRYGRDVAGALVISNEPPGQRSPGVERYTRERLEEDVADLDVRPLGVYDDSELSVAGLQNKMLLVRLPDGSWGRPVRGRPSTHILKADSATRPGVVEAEAHCLALARAVGLTSIDVELTSVGAQRCLIVSRFDRAPGADGAVQRIHQEDLGQGAGRLEKYQSRARRGPGYADGARLLEAYAARPEEQLRRLLAIATFTLAIGNADAHAKNLALLHDTPESVVLAPLYDTVPTIMWPSLRTEAAMSINGHHSLLNCDRFDLVAEARRWPLSERVATTTVQDMLEALLAAVPDALDPESRLARTVSERVRCLLNGAVPGEPVAPFDEPNR